MVINIINLTRHVQGKLYTKVLIKSNLVKSFIMPAVLRRSVQRVGGAHCGVIEPTGKIASFEEILQR